VPLGSTVDMVSRIEQQIERFAPGFGDRILQRHVMLPADVERHNDNYAGGYFAAERALQSVLRAQAPGA
jgi:phytoene dehydrogenase-like protein